MNNKNFMILLRRFLINNFSLHELRAFEKKLNAGELTGVFEKALNTAIETKTNEIRDGFHTLGSKQ